MSTLTNYIVIRSDPFELQAEQQRTFTFELPGELVMDLNAARPILAYKISPLALSSWATRTTLVIDMNEHRLAYLQLEHTIPRGLWEIFPAYFLYVNSTNLVQFRLLSGAVQLADVVLWFQRQASSDKS